ncbi:MAG: xanthine dehydrogenase family protein molybdopterin-binding subunit [Desulfotomaculaceae bacterium]|nr:xanthine dehydrogenase family protein molybdopterin-binding subunit [Desulfotomaculaceae bacterium]
MITDYRYIGKPTLRKDAFDIVTGKAKFISDLTVPGMLYGKILRSPLPHALIKSINTTEAKLLPGVKAVLTYKDVPDWKAGARPQHVRVLDSKVRYVGQAVALVAAETEKIAEEAIRLIKVEYEPLPAVYDVEEAMQPDAPLIYEQFNANVLPPESRAFGPRTLQEIVIGDVDKGLAEADFVVEGTCAYENIPNPLPPETPGVIASWEGADNLTVWSASQGPHMFKVTLQPLMGGINIRSIGSPVGASYGSKYMSWQFVMPAAALSKATGKPVKLCFKKSEHLAAFTVRLGSRIHGKVGMKKDGTVTFLSGDWLVNTGAFSECAQFMIAVGCGEAQLMLRCPNWSLKPKVICTNRTASGQVRGFGGQELKCALIPLLTMAMEKANIDPVNFFKKNYVKPGDGYYWRDGEWWVCQGTDYTRAIEKGAETFGWKEKWQGWLKPTAVDGARRRGVGVGVHGNADIGEDVSEAFVRLDGDGKAIIHCSLAEHGTGQRSNICKMVAEVLQLPLERVFFTPVDSLVNPVEIGPVGSRGTYAIGNAVIAAAEDAQRQLFEKMAPLFKVTPEDLETSEGMVYVKGKPGAKLPWSKGLHYYGACLGRGRFEPDFSKPNFMIVFSEVEVDVETGKVDLIRVVCATDVGQVIDPPSLTNQLNGCLGSGGIDSALFEETIIDKRLGRIMNANMIDYKWRTFAELPEMELVVLETPVAGHRFHAIGVGEIATAPGPSAVLMAVSNAIGVRLNDYPLTPDRILNALGKVNAAKRRGKQ